MGTKQNLLVLILSALAVAVSLYPIFMDLSTSRSMVVTVISSSPLILDEKSVKSSVKVVAAEKELSEPRLVLLSLENNGSVPIPADSFEGPVVLTFGEAALITASRAASDPGIVRAKTAQEGNAIQIDAGLFNPGDKLEIAAITDGRVPDVRVDARIFGVKEVTVVDASRPIERKRGKLIGALDLIAGLFLSAAAGLFYAMDVRKLGNLGVPYWLGPPLAWAALVGSMSTFTLGASSYFENKTVLLASTVVPVPVIAIFWWYFAKQMRRSTG